MPSYLSFKSLVFYQLGTAPPSTLFTLDEKKEIADPYVIAKAKSTPSSYVVTEDGYNYPEGTRTEEDDTIASVCEKMKIPCINLKDFIDLEITQPP